VKTTGVKFILELWPDIEGTPEELLRYAVDSIERNPDLLWDVETSDRVYREVKVPVKDDSHPIYVEADCGCGCQLIYTPEGWQHRDAPWIWGDDHDPDPSPEDVARAKAWQAEYDKGLEG
jgi:hypothetical protein